VYRTLLLPEQQCRRRTAPHATRAAINPLLVVRTWQGRESEDPLRLWRAVERGGVLQLNTGAAGRNASQPSDALLWSNADAIRDQLSFPQHSQRLELLSHQ
jgi:hypothetical protein